MKLGLALDYAAPRLDIPVALIQQAEALGFHAVWSAEAYGSDALSPLAYLAAVTTEINLGTAVAQVSARAPAVLAMHLATIDQLAGGDRVIAGLGLSGPQVVEGWHGISWAKPRARLRDTVSIVRKVLAREGPVCHVGEGVSLPYTGSDAVGTGKPLKSILHGNPNIPLYLGTGSEGNVSMTAEIADGWIPMGFCPGMIDIYQPWLDRGFEKRPSGEAPKNFDIIASVQVDHCDDVQAAIEERKILAGTYVGGMGVEGKNFHADQMARRGFPEAAERIQELFKAGRYEEAIAAVPDDYIEQTTLIGSVSRIREKYQAWENSGATGMILHLGRGDHGRVVRLMAEITGAEPRSNR